LTAGDFSISRGHIPRGDGLACFRSLRDHEGFAADSRTHGPAAPRRRWDGTEVYFAGTGYAESRGMVGCLPGTWMRKIPARRPSTRL